jgi:hypothetical protein
MEDQDSWVKILGQKAQVHRRLYAVIVYGVRKADVDIKNIKATIRKLQVENRPLYGFLDLYRIAWPTKTIANEKTHGSLIMEVATSTQANRIIIKNISIGSEIKICELFARKCRLTQYYNYQLYNYIAPKCRNHTKCGHCAKSYSTRDCDFQGLGPATQRCGACASPGYTS